jgi:hypothetical protein
MSWQSYREPFQAHLEDLIRAGGGDVGRAVTLVNAYQGLDPAARHVAFREWLVDASLACSQCGGSFKPSSEDIEEEDPIRCRWCVHGLRALGVEPVPGWRRTWAR